MDKRCIRLLEEMISILSDRMGTRYIARHSQGISDRDWEGGWRVFSTILWMRAPEGFFGCVGKKCMWKQGFMYASLSMNR